MKHQPARSFVIFSFLIFLFAAPGKAQVSPRTTTLFDFDWRFHRGGAQGAEMVSFDDADWRKLDLPHDWSIEDIPGTSSPFDPDAIGQVSTGFAVGGTGWYRKHFPVQANLQGKRIYLQFDGVYMNADVWLNGTLLGNHPYGYTSFWYDITDYLKAGEENILAVQVKNEGQNSRWYTGSGIYRHVWLTTVEPIHIAPWGTYITTPGVTTTTAQAIIKTTLRNTTDKVQTVTVVTRILNSKRMEVAMVRAEQTLEAGASKDVEQRTTVQSPERWSIESPILYTAVSEVLSNNSVTDRYETSFGIRTISFDAVNGFQLNGKSLKLKGGCVHHDNGPLGARAYDRAEERRVELLKASGYNAIRCAHNPPSPAFLDACDRLGMLVIDEAFDMWINPNNPHDYHLFFDKWWKRDVESMVFRDRNHPSIILWSIGNEIRGMETPEVVAVANKLGTLVRELDPTRPVTAAVNAVNEKKDPFFAALDIGGYNYARAQYVPDHQRKPERVMFATESYPLEAYEYWMGVTDNAWVIGDFVWTSFDYIGEASIGWRGYMQEKSFYPWTLAFCGDIDICGWKRPQSYYRDAMWTKDNRVSIFVKPPQPSFPVNPKREYWSIWHWDDVVADWNWDGQENKPLDVTVYSSAESVELFLNGKSLGKKPTNRSTKFMATWNVPYQHGVLKAIGYVAKKKVSTSELSSTDRPAALKLTADRTTLAADGQSLSYITVDIIDSKGLLHPKADNVVKVEIEGPGKVIAVANANPMSTDSFQQMQRKAWQGKCLVIVKSDTQPGTIKLKVTSEGIQSAQAEIAVAGK